MPSLQEALPKKWEELKAMKNLIADFKQTTAPPAVDHKTIEEWINVTLNESEELQGVPEQAIKRDSRTALSRYGIDRFSLLNAGIPNDEVTRLYKSMYVHTEGFIRVIKDISISVNESTLTGNPLHPSR